MTNREAERLRSAAAEASLARIARDHACASGRIRPLLAHIAGHLFVPGLNVASLKRACGVRDNSISNRFHQEIGTPPASYITDRRLETASRLLRETGVEVWRMADLLGYSSLQVFSRAFTRWAGIRPTAYRRRAVRRDERPETVSARPMTPARSSTVPSRPPAAPLAASLEPEAITEIRATAVWEAVRDKPAEDQRRIVSQARSPSLFELLHRKSREEGRSDRKRGVALSELAVEAVPRPRHGNDDEAAGLFARAWSWVANARSLALDFPAAEVAFDRSEAWLPEGREAARHAEFWYLKAGSRLRQHAIEPARVMIDRAVDFAHRAGETRPQAEILIRRGQLAIEQARHEDAISDLEHAIRLLGRDDSSYEKLCALMGLVLARIGAGDVASAITLLPTIRVQSQRHRSGLVGGHLLWLEGLAEQARGRHRSAAARLLSAFRTFARLDGTAQAAGTILDAAVVYAELGRRDKVRRLAAEALRLLDKVNAQAQAFAALTLLQQALAADRVTAAVLWQARGHMVGASPVAPRISERRL